MNWTKVWQIAKKVAKIAIPIIIDIFVARKKQKPTAKSDENLT